MTYIPEFLLPKAQSLAKIVGHAWGQTPLTSKSLWTQKEIHDATLVHMGDGENAITAPTVDPYGGIKNLNGVVHWWIYPDNTWLEVIQPCEDPTLLWIMDLPSSNSLEDVQERIHQARRQGGLTVLTAQIQPDWNPAKIKVTVETPEPDDIWVSLEVHHIDTLHCALCVFVLESEATEHCELYLLEQVQLTVPELPRVGL